MFDDDLSYLDACAREIRKYGLNVSYVGTHTLVVILKTSTDHTVGIIRKKKMIPFYQAFLIETPPTSTNWVELVETDEFLKWIFSNRETVRQFAAADIQGHANFQNEFLRELKERFR